MELTLILIIALVVFDVVSFVWGFDSRDGIDSPQSELCQRWPASY
jgi:hypothetical protein